MHRLGLVPRTRGEPFRNFGLHPVGSFLDLTVDGSPLLQELEQAACEDFDVVTAVTEEFPRGAVKFLDAMLGADDLWSIEMGAEDGEVPIYTCPIDYDPLCGGIVAAVARSNDVVRVWKFSHTSTDEAYNDTVTAALQHLSYSFDRVQFDDVLSQARAEFAERARVWVPPDDRVTAVRRWGRRVRRRLSR